MKFKYPQFLVLLLFIIPMLACNSFFGSADTPEDSTAAESESAADTSLAVTADDSSTDDSGTNDSSADSSTDDSSADSQTTIASGAPVTTIQPALAINSNTLPFQTLRAEMNFTTTSGDDVASMNFISQRDIPNQAFSYEINALGVPDMEEFGSGAMNVVSIDGTLYLPFEGECMAMNAEGGTPMDQFLEGNNELIEDENLQVSFLADETLLGLPVKTYAVVGLGDAGMEELTDVEGNISVYTTPEGKDVVLRAEMTGTSATNPLTEAPISTTVSYSFSITDADIELNIVAPEGCENALQMPNLGGLGAAAEAVNAGGGQSDGEFPAYPGAEFMANVAGVQTFMIPQSAIDTAQISPRDFYVQAFADLGYTVGQEFTAAPTTTIMFQGNGSGVQMVLAEEAGGILVTLLGLP